MSIKKISPTFVEFIPINLEEGNLYISMRYGTVTHLCPCGCKEKVVTPLGKNGWTLKFDGTISMTPSIGNYHLRCHSHYYIINNEIQWIPEYKSDLPRTTKRKRNLHFKKKFPFISFM